MNITFHAGAFANTWVSVQNRQDQQAADAQRLSGPNPAQQLMQQQAASASDAAASRAASRIAATNMHGQQVGRVVNVKA